MGWLKRTEPPEKSAPKMAIVRRDLSPEYYFFLEIFAKQNGVEVILDRRADERRKRVIRVFGDRRASDRREPLPPTWRQADVVIPR
jgi:hypothetical protein